MAAAFSDDRDDEGVERFLSDFRSWNERRLWHERRSADRRQAPRNVVLDRRSGADRRTGADRRVIITDRRRPMPELFTRTEATFIRAMLSDARSDAACPRCTGPLLVGPLGFGGDPAAQQVHCTRCRHRAVLSNVPSQPPGSANR